MLSNTITLPVDVVNNGTLVDKVYTRDDVTPGKAVYEGPDKTVILGDSIILTRTKAVRSGNFFGVHKNRIKLSKDFNVPTAVVGTEVVQPFIMDLYVNKPVGVTDAQITERFQTMRAFLDHAEAMLLVAKEQI